MASSNSKMTSVLTKFILLNTRLIVGSYTALTLPFYAALQRPWVRLKAARSTKHAQLMMANDPEKSYWTRYGPPVVLPHDYHLMNSIQEIFHAMKRVEDPARLRLGYREMLNAQDKYDEKGDILKQDGRIIKEVEQGQHFNWLNNAQIFEKVENLIKGFDLMGINANDKVIIYADTRLEWFLSAVSLIMLRSPLVTLFPTLGINGFVHGANQTQAKYIITSFEMLEKIAPVIDQTPHLERIIYMRYDFQKNLTHKLPKFPDKVRLVAWDSVEESGQGKPMLQLLYPKQSDVILIMYTSGTTGVPKAVVFTAKQVKASLVALASTVTDLAHEAHRHVYVSFLPLAHILGFMFETMLFIGGVRIGYSSPYTLSDFSPGVPKGKPGDLTLLKPTVLVAVPLILDRIVKEIYLKLHSRTPFSAPLFDYLINYKIRWTKRGFTTPIVNALLCRRIREQFGGNLEYIICGGAALNPKTEELIRAALDVKLLQGYGLTETTGGVVGMRREDITEGFSGYPLGGMRIRLKDWPEGGYTVNDKPNPRGEIVIGGESIAQEYFGMEEESKEVFFKDSDNVSWFYSGDIGEINARGNLKIIDRKKDLAKLTNGEYISLGKIESTIKTVALVENCCICINEKSEKIVCLVTGSEKQVNLLAQKLGKSNLSWQEKCQDETICSIIRKEVLETCRASGLHERETPVAIHVCSEEWLPNNDLLTGAFKLKRRNVIKFYEKEIEQMFNKILKKYIFEKKFYSTKNHVCWVR